MKKRTRLLSMVLALMMLVSMIILGTTTAFASEDSISYSFKNSKAGFAEGKILFETAPGTTQSYTLYWADNEKALEGYRALGTLSGSGEITMPAHTAIPADAEKVIAIEGSAQAPTSSCTVKNASAVFDIPEGKKLSFDSEDALYTFGSVGDPQIANDSYGSNSYPNDEIHTKKAFETLHKRDVDFVVSSGDTVNDQNGKQTFAAEYKVYQKILAESPYAKPIYEANGNHDVGTVWNKNSNYYNDDAPFIKGTGLDSDPDTIEKGKPYFEITEPVTGDHFIFMALEGGFYTNQGVQFSKEQLDWLEGLLKKYSTDGKNIFIIEHANIAGWGSGDKTTADYYYDLGLDKTKDDVKRFISLMETYKECVIITAHTHLELSAQYNYSDNNGTSAVMMHNSAIGGVRRLVNGKIDRSAVLGMSEGYIVEVYEDCILFNGINLYYNEIMPLCSYIIPFDTEAIENPTEKPTETPTVKPTETPTEKPTEAPTVKPTEAPTVKPTDAPTEKPTDTPTEKPSEPDTIPLYGDADLNGTVNIKDATTIQKYAAGMITFDDIQFTQANVTGDKAVNVRDATAIQKYVAGIISVFPSEKTAPAVLSASKDDAKNTLDTYYTYSSYDQYMALKHAYLYGDGTENLDALVAELMAIVEATGGDSQPAGGEITLYFTNNYNWSTVKAYVWGSGGKLSEWPGTEMTYVKTNGQNQKIYSVTFNSDDYQNIIFTDGSKQTVDITLSGEGGIGYYISGESGGKYTCSTYTFS